MNEHSFSLSLPMDKFTYINRFSLVSVTANRILCFICYAALAHLQWFQQYSAKLMVVL